MKIKQAIDELTHLLQEHGDVDLYMSIDVKTFIQHIENGHTAPVSGAKEHTHASTSNCRGGIGSPFRPNFIYSAFTQTYFNWR